MGRGDWVGSGSSEGLVGWKIIDQLREMSGVLVGRMFCWRRASLHGEEDY